ncbi:hypothetical protein [Streptomyces sp. NPDC050564]|uniref:hypothetical protein n=1 Tax=Streptomyces sp. NPDC050564 TaxID=3365631 RepID=UPI0037A3AE21
MATALAGAGSRIDVGLDVFALATFGLGRLATPGMRAAEEGVRSATRGAGAMSLGKAAFKSAVTDEMRSAGRVFKTGVKGSAEWEAARVAMSKGAKGMYAAKNTALTSAKELSGMALPKMGALKNLLGGGAEAASLKSFLGQAAERFPDSARIASSIAKGSGAIRLSQGAFAAGTGVDAFDKAFGMTGPYFSSGSWVGSNNLWIQAKTWTTHGVGSSW